MNKYGKILQVSREKLNALFGVPEEVEMDILMDPLNDYVSFKFRTYGRPVYFKFMGVHIELKPMAEGQYYQIVTLSSICTCAMDGADE